MALAAWRWGQKIVFSSHPALTKNLGTWKTRDEGLGVPLARWRLSRRCGCPHQLEWCFPCVRQGAKSHSSELISSLCKETEGAGEKKLRLREVQSLCQRPMVSGRLRELRWPHYPRRLCGKRQCHVVGSWLPPGRTWVRTGKGQCPSFHITK